MREPMRIIAVLAVLAASAVPARADMAPAPPAASEVDVRQFGAVGDGQSKEVSASISAGSAALSVDAPIFQKNDSGKAILLPGAGPSGRPLATTIATATSPRTATLRDPAQRGLTGSHVTLAWGTPNAAAFRAARDSVPPGHAARLLIPRGQFYLETPVGGARRDNTDRLIAAHYSDNAGTIGPGFVDPAMTVAENGPVRTIRSAIFNIDPPPQGTRIDNRSVFNANPSRGYDAHWFEYRSQADRAQGAAQESAVVLHSMFERGNGLPQWGVWQYVGTPAGNVFGARSYGVTATVTPRERNTPLLTVSEPIFQASDKGKTVTIGNAGGNHRDHLTDLAEIISPTVATLRVGPAVPPDGTRMIKILIGPVPLDGAVAAEINPTRGGIDPGWANNVGAGGGGWKFIPEFVDRDGKKFGNNVEFALAASAHSRIWGTALTDSFGNTPRFYNGLLIEPDSIAAQGRGIYIGGNVAAEDPEVDHAPIQIDYRWAHGIRLDGGSFDDGNALLLNGATGQAIAWTNEPPPPLASRPGDTSEPKPIGAVIRAIGRGPDMELRLTPSGKGRVAIEGPVAHGVEILSGRQSVRMAEAGSVAYAPTAPVLQLFAAAPIGHFRIALPAADALADGQVVRIVSTQPVQALVVAGGDGGQIAGAPTMLTPATPIALLWDAESRIWFRM